MHHMLHILMRKAGRKKCWDDEKIKLKSISFPTCYFFHFLFHFFVISKNEEKFSRLNEFVRFLSFFLAYGTDDDDDDDKGRNEYRERFVYEKFWNTLLPIKMNVSQCSTLWVSLCDIVSILNLCFHSAFILVSLSSE